MTGSETLAMITCDIKFIFFPYKITAQHISLTVFLGPVTGYREWVKR